MIKTICDVCGKEITRGIMRETRLEDMNFCISSNGVVWDICNSCRDDLNTLIRNKRNNAESEE